jgi:hypothetical protein
MGSGGEKMMKLAEIAEELAKLKPEPEPSADEADDEATKIELEKFLMEHPEVTDEAILGEMRIAEDVENGVDASTAAARERCRQLGIGDFDRNRPKKPPVAIPETDVDPEEAWLKKVLEKRRAQMEARAQARGADPARRRPPLQQPQQSWARPRRHGLYAALDWD